uniref:Uncharacterized protein n=1 Tax=Arundo donax TaxID=35708 RepID=A0A0A9F772_ARUDO
MAACIYWGCICEFVNWISCVLLCCRSSENISKPIWG